MALEYLEEECKEYEEEGKVDLEGDLINSLKEIDRVKHRNKKKK